MNDKTIFMKNSSRIPQLLLRIALGTGFLVAVSDRLGLLGQMGPENKNVEWGNWQNFINYTETLMPFLDRQAVSIMGGIATTAEAILGILLIVGYKTRLAAIGSCVLTLVFALFMTVFLGIQRPISFSVFTFCTASLLLATLPAYKWSIDDLGAPIRD